MHKNLAVNPFRLRIPTGKKMLQCNLQCLINCNSAHGVPSEKLRARCPLPAHHSDHIHRYADSTLRVNRGASISAEPCMRERNVARNSLSLVKSPANATTIFTYSSRLGAMNSGKPTLDKILTPPRPTASLPAKLTTGTPIHNASQVV